MTANEINKEVDDFLTSIGNPKLNKRILVWLLKYANQINTPVVQWEKKHLYGWLKSLNAVNLNSIYGRLGYFNKYSQYVREKEGLDFHDIKFEPSEIYEILDTETLINTTITFAQYNDLLKQMIDLQYDNHNIFDIRDRVIFQLAWLGLTSGEIKYLKVSDITFDWLDGSDIIKIVTPDNRYVSKDKQLISDVHECMTTNEYSIITQRGAKKTHALLPSAYLIRPIQVGRIKESSGTLAAPSISLQDSIRKNNLFCADLDVTKITIENIKRSKIIYMFSTNFGAKNHIDVVAEQFDLKSPNMIYLLNKISEIKYNRR